MQGFTKEQYEAEIQASTETEVSERKKSTRAAALCKKVYAWQEEKGWHAWTADLCDNDIGVSVTPDFCFHSEGKRPDPDTLPELHTAQFLRTEACGENEGICGKYKLVAMARNTWRIERSAPPTPAE